MSLLWKLGGERSDLGYQERLDALHAAMRLIQAQKGTMGLPTVTYGTLDTWAGVMANLMAICSDIGEEWQREREQR